ncbi:glycosyltransferase [Mesorhizobium sp. STM 4661]|uniref:glycosyltransferase family 2 protein n=1 Tax=Mesorhizobium sp. STM 4661 TaxID=1297570 RepID=UPI0002BF546F|nr:glycosyltransferase [Mesorhizobium sp. STM 4661]CCV13670.1 hypothetical protein MESS4_590033 [Mesorhizobium sp. STM 4661]
MRRSLLRKSSQQNPPDSNVLFSVLMPLEFHRDQATIAIRKWRQDQTLRGSAFELILVASHDANAADMDEIRQLLAPQDRLVQTSAKHDIAQVAEAARHARADLLFFTESHVWPTPTVLEQCLDVFSRRPEWAGFSCRTHASAPNKLARSEARMYEADIQHGMTKSSWRKILDQCFATRRKAYEEAAGFDPGFGHFSEWLLAARYHKLGLSIGYVPEIELVHHYIGQWPELRRFTEDFVAGEALWLARGGPRQEPMIEIPFEWSSRGERRKDLAQHILQIAWHQKRRKLRPQLHCGGMMQVLRRHWVAALLGDRLDTISARATLFWRHVALMLARAFGSDAQLDRVFRQTIAALVHERRLRTSPEVQKVAGDGSLWTPDELDAGRAAGIYAAEVYDGVAFRWSSDAASVELKLPVGEHLVQVQTLAHILMTRVEPLFYLNGQILPIEAANVADGTFVLKVARDSDNPAIFGWVGEHQQAPNDSRILGLPITRISRLGSNDT